MLHVVDRVPTHGREICSATPKPLGLLIQFRAVTQSNRANHLSSLPSVATIFSTPPQLVAGELMVIAVIQTYDCQRWSGISLPSGGRDLFLNSYLSEFTICGLKRSYASGTVIELRRNLIAEPDPHGHTQPEFKLGWRPVIKLDGLDEVIGGADLHPRSPNGDRGASVTVALAQI
jgi:hypothetical protein